GDRHGAPLQVREYGVFPVPVVDHDEVAWAHVSGAWIGRRVLRERIDFSEDVAGGRRQDRQPERVVIRVLCATPRERDAVSNNDEIARVPKWLVEQVIILMRFSSTLEDHPLAIEDR